MQRRYTVLACLLLASCATPDRAAAPGAGWLVEAQAPGGGEAWITLASGLPLADKAFLVDLTPWQATGACFRTARHTATTRQEATAPRCVPPGTAARTITIPQP